MNNETPVMFKFKGEDSKITTWNANEAVGLFRDKHGLYLSIKADDGPFIRLTKCYTARRFYHAQRDAQLKAQGCLPPEGQQPFCMASAIELGVEFSPHVFYVLTPVKGSELDVFRGWEIKPHNQPKYRSFAPCDNPHETARLRELGVKRYQKAGE